MRYPAVKRKAGQEKGPVPSSSQPRPEYSVDGRAVASAVGYSVRADEKAARVLLANCKLVRLNGYEKRTRNISGGWLIVMSKLTQAESLGESRERLCGPGSNGVRCARHDATS